MIITDIYLPNKKWCAFANLDEADQFKKWPNEHGATPRDLSLGYIDNKEFGRLHVYPVELLKNKLKDL